VELLSAFWVFMGVKVKVRSVVSLQYFKDPTQTFEAVPLIRLFQDPVISMSHGFLPIHSSAFFKAAPLAARSTGPKVL
jgi:hypothetical protein